MEQYLPVLLGQTLEGHRDQRLLYHPLGHFARQRVAFSFAEASSPSERRIGFTPELAVPTPVVDGKVAGDREQPCSCRSLRSVYGCRVAPGSQERFLDQVLGLGAGADQAPGEGAKGVTMGGEHGLEQCRRLCLSGSRPSTDRPAGGSVSTVGNHSFSFSAQGVQLSLPLEGV